MYKWPEFRPKTAALLILSCALAGCQPPEPVDHPTEPPAAESPAEDPGQAEGTDSTEASVPATVDSPAERVSDGADASAEATPSAEADSPEQTGTTVEAAPDPATENSEPRERPEVETGVTSQETALWASPALDSARIAVLQPAESVTILETRGGWYRVFAGDREGWVRLAHVRLDRDSATTSGVADIETGRRGAGNVAATTGIRGLMTDAEEAEANRSPGADALVGTWRLSVGLPGVSAPAILTVVRTPDGYAGSYVDALGEAPVASIVVEEATFRFELERDSPAGVIVLRYTGVVTGDRMAGQLRPRAGGVPFTGRRE